MTALALECRAVTKTFGGVRAVERRHLSCAARQPLRLDWAERRRQDHVI